MCNKNIYFLFIIFFFECAYATSGFNNDNIADIKKVNLIQASKIKSLENQKSLLRNKLKKMQDIESQGNTNQFLPEQYSKIISTTYNSASKIQDKKTIDNGNLSQKTPKSFDSFNHASKVVLEQKYLPKNQIKASISEKNLNQLVENHKGGGGLEQKVNELERKEKLLMEEKQQKEKELTQKISEFEKLSLEEKNRHNEAITNLEETKRKELLAREDELNNLRLAELGDQERRFEKLSLEEKERHNEAITNLEESKKKELLAREDELNNLRLAELADQEKRFKKLSLEEKNRHNEAITNLEESKKKELLAQEDKLNNLHLAKLLEKQNEFDKLTTEEKERHEQTVLNLKDDHKQNLLAKEKELNNLRLAELADQERRFEKLSLEEKERHNKLVAKFKEDENKRLDAKLADWNKQLEKSGHENKLFLQLLKQENLEHQKNKQDQERKLLDKEKEITQLKLQEKLLIEKNEAQEKLFKDNQIYDIAELRKTLKNQQAKYQDLTTQFLTKGEKMISTKHNKENEIRNNDEPTKFQIKKFK